MATRPNYRRIAETTLGQAEAELSRLSEGQIAADVFCAHAAKAQALAAVSAAQALLHIGDVLSDKLAPPDFDVEVD